MLINCYNPVFFICSLRHFSNKKIIRNELQIVYRCIWYIMMNRQNSMVNKDRE